MSLPKLVCTLIGNKSTGKSSLLQKFISNLRTTKLEIWPGQSAIVTFNTSEDLILTGDLGDCSTVYLVVFDITCTKSFNACCSILQNIKNSCYRSPVVLVGNKLDLCRDRKVTRMQGEQLAAKYSVSFFEASCVSEYNVDYCFMSLLSKSRSILTVFDNHVLFESNFTESDQILDDLYPNFPNDLTKSPLPDCKTLQEDEDCVWLSPQFNEFCFDDHDLSDLEGYAMPTCDLIEFAKTHNPAVPNAQVNERSRTISSLSGITLCSIGITL